jgi:hypothetical protein
MFDSLVFRAEHRCGTRSTARTLRIAQDSVTEALRSIEAWLWYVNADYLSGFGGRETIIAASRRYCISAHGNMKTRMHF